MQNAKDQVFCKSENFHGSFYVTISWCFIKVYDPVSVIPFVSPALAPCPTSLEECTDAGLKTRHFEHSLCNILENGGPGWNTTLGVPYPKFSGKWPWNTFSDSDIDACFYIGHSYTWLNFTQFLPVSVETLFLTSNSTHAPAGTIWNFNSWLQWNVGLITGIW